MQIIKPHHTFFVFRLWDSFFLAAHDPPATHRHALRRQLHNGQSRIYKCRPCNSLFFSIKKARSACSARWLGGRDTLGTFWIPGNPHPPSSRARVPLSRPAGCLRSLQSCARDGTVFVLRFTREPSDSRATPRPSVPARRTRASRSRPPCPATARAGTRPPPSLSTRARSHLGKSSGTRLGSRAGAARSGRPSCLRIWCPNLGPPSPPLPPYTAILRSVPRPLSSRGSSRVARPIRGAPLPSSR